jgi:glucokinase
MSIYIGCDLGGTNIKAGLVDIDAGKVLLSKSTPIHAQEGPDAVMKRIAEFVKGLITESDTHPESIKGMGVSAPGRLDMEKGETVFITNFPGKWPGVPLCATLQGYLDIPVVLLNDVRAITLGEHTFGAGRGIDNMVCFAIGTGIGGGLVINGHLVLGVNGTAGELGHQTVDIHGERCGCGNYGCLETLASGPAIASMGVRAVQQGMTTKIGELVGYDLNKIDAEVIAQAARQGDEIANEIWRDVGSYLGTGIANVIITVAPQRVVISGGVAAAGDLLLKPVRETLRKRVFLVPLEKVEIVIGQLGKDAGILGLAKWAQLQGKE